MQGIGVGQFAAYYVVWTLVRGWNVVFTPFGWEWRIREGEFSAALLRPQHPIHFELAWWTGNMLAEAWGRSFTTPESMIGAMVNVRLPGRFEATESNADRIRDALEAAGFEVPVYAAPDALETRVSLQIYNDHDDVKALADAVNELT